MVIAGAYHWSREEILSIPLTELDNYYPYAYEVFKNVIGKLKN